MSSTNDLVFFRFNNPRQFTYEPKDWEVVEKLAEEAKEVCVAYMESDGGLKYRVSDHRCQSYHSDEKNLRIATGIIHRLYARHLLYRTNLPEAMKTPLFSDIFSLKNPGCDFGSTNNDNLQHLLRFWMNTYLIRETDEFKEEWNKLDYIMKYTHATDKFEYLWNHYWIYINFVVYGIYQKKTHIYDDVDHYEKNIHPFEMEEFTGLCSKFGSNSNGLLPRCAWTEQGEFVFGCDTLSGFQGINNNGVCNIYSRKPCSRWNIKSVVESNGVKKKRNRRNRISIQLLFYRMLVGTIQPNCRLEKETDIEFLCQKTMSNNVCVNPTCYHQVTTCFKRKRKPVTDEDKQLFKAFRESSPWIEDWVHLD